MNPIVASLLEFNQAFDIPTLQSPGMSNEDLIELKLDEINRLNTETLIIQQEYNKQREIREQLSSEETLLTSFSFENLEE